MQKLCEIHRKGKEIARSTGNGGDNRKTGGARRKGEYHQLTLISVNVGSLWVFVK